MELLYKDLTYKIRRAVFSVRNFYGPGQKERIYHEALKDELHNFSLPYVYEKHLDIFSLRDGRKVGTFMPDFIIDDKVVLEVKAAESLPKRFEEQLTYYLRNTKYEIGFLVNFGSEELDIRRRIFTNDRKLLLSVSV